MFKPALQGLPQGEHGFHLHENPSCEPAMKEGKPQAAAGAGSHFDPAMVVAFEATQDGFLAIAEAFADDAHAEGAAAP